jgi:hypothetical protein
MKAARNQARFTLAASVCQWDVLAEVFGVATFLDVHHPAGFVVVRVLSFDGVAALLVVWVVEQVASGQLERGQDFVHIAAGVAVENDTVEVAGAAY